MNKIEELIHELCPVGVIFKEIGEVAKILNGYAFKSSKYVKSGIRVIRISDVQKGKVSDKDLKFYPIEFNNKIKNYLLKTNDLVMSLTGNVGRVAMLSENHLPAGLNQRVACIRTNNKLILTRFLFHYFDQNTFEIDAMANASGGGQKNMSTTWLAKYKIPIPPLTIQQEIVNILDKFTSLEAELEAELEARKKQYEYYRNELLNFEGKDVEWKTLGEVGKVCMCKRIMKHETTSTGEIPFFKIGTFGKIPDAYITQSLYEKYRNTYSFPKVGTVLISASGTIGRTVIYDGKPAYFQDSNIVWIDNDERIVMNRFLYYYYKIVEWKTDGGTISRLYNNNLANTNIPIPTLDEQDRIVGILDKFDALVNDISTGLPAEIKARRKQYEYYRGKLLDFKPKSTNN